MHEWTFGNKTVLYEDVVNEKYYKKMCRLQKACVGFPYVKCLRVTYEKRDSVVSAR